MSSALPSWYCAVEWLRRQGADCFRLDGAVHSLGSSHRPDSICVAPVERRYDGCVMAVHDYSWHPRSGGRVHAPPQWMQRLSFIGQDLDAAVHCSARPCEFDEIDFTNKEYILQYFKN